MARLEEVEHVAQEGMFCFKHPLVLDEHGFHEFRARRQPILTDVLDCVQLVILNMLCEVYLAKAASSEHEPALEVV